MLSSKIIPLWPFKIYFNFRATATSPLFFNFAPPQRAPPFLVRASGAMALKVAQVPSTVEFFGIVGTNQGCGAGAARSRPF